MDWFFSIQITKNELIYTHQQINMQTWFSIGGKWVIFTQAHTHTIETHQLNKCWNQIDETTLCSKWPETFCLFLNFSSKISLIQKWLWIFFFEIVDIQIYWFFLKMNFYRFNFSKIKKIKMKIFINCSISKLEWKWYTFFT